MIPDPVLNDVLATHGRESKYLNFSILDKMPKTHVIAIETKYCDLLGKLKWHGPWRQYVFKSEADCIFNSGCMTDITRLTDAINALQKETRK